MGLEIKQFVFAISKTFRYRQLIYIGVGSCLIIIATVGYLIFRGEESSIATRTETAQITQTSQAEAAEQIPGEATLLSELKQITTSTELKKPDTTDSKIKEKSKPQETSKIEPATCNQDKTNCEHPQINSALNEQNVFVIRYLPDEDNNGQIDFESTGYNGSVSDLRNKTKQSQSQAAYWLTEASRYKGYKDLNARPSLGYKISDEIEFTTNPPKGLKVPWNNAYRPDYIKILSTANICDLVDNKGIDQVWIWTQHHKDIEPVETNLYSKHGDISNSERSNDLPPCNNSYMLLNLNFTRGPAEILHNHGHQLEAFLTHKDSNGIFWNNFVGSSTGQSALTSTPKHCGWTHYAPNSVSDYDTSATRTVQSDCETWNPDGPSTTKPVNCETWQKYAYNKPGCIDDGGLAFSVWWMQNLPGHNNGLTFKGKALRNWWEYYSRTDVVLGGSLHYK